jgi:hypothetical protein
MDTSLVDTSKSINIIKISYKLMFI